jgi:hypothetical protein
MLAQPGDDLDLDLLRLLRIRVLKERRRH